MDTPPPVTPAPASAPAASGEERTWAMLCHLSALAGYLIPLGNILGPFLVWQIKKNSMPSINQHGKDALNFQISILIYFIISCILMLVLVGVFLMAVVGLYSLVCIIIASVKANNGENWKYPLSIRFIQ